MQSDRTATETTKHDKTKAKSQKSTPEKRNATARTRSYPYYCYFPTHNIVLIISVTVLPMFRILPFAGLLV